MAESPLILLGIPGGDPLTISRAEYAGPLDLVSGAIVAYSATRALRAAWRGQNLITIRRDSDDAEQNFRADTASGEVSVAQISSFIGSSFTQIGAVEDTLDTITLVSATGVRVGQPISGTDIPPGTTVIDVSAAPIIQISQAATGTNATETLTFTPRGYVSGLFDQSGNGRDLAQATLNDQSLWVASANGGKSGIEDGGSLELLLEDTYTLNPVITMVGVGKTVDITLDNTGYINIQYSSSPYIDIHRGAGTFGANFDAPTPGYAVFDAAAQEGQRSFKVNGTALGVAAVNDTGSIVNILVTGHTIFLDPGAGFQELILYNSYLSDPDRLAIRQNEAAFYGITL